MVDYKKKYLKYKLKYLNIKKKLGGAQEAQTAPQEYPKCADADVIYPCTAPEESYCNQNQRFITGCNECKKDNKIQLGTCEYDDRNDSSDDEGAEDYDNNKKKVHVPVWKGLYTDGPEGFS